MTTTPIGLIVGDIQIIGLELSFDAATDHRGRVWVPIEPGTHLLYGKNGAGKTTIVNALKALFGNKIDGASEFKVFIKLLSHNSDQPVTDSIFEDDQNLEGSEPSDDEEVPTFPELGLFTRSPEDIKGKLVNLSSKAYWWNEGYRLDLNEWDQYVAHIESFGSSVPPLSIEQFISSQWGVDEAVDLAQARLAYLAFCFRQDETFWNGEAPRPHRDLVRAAVQEAMKEDYWSLSCDGKLWKINPAVRFSESTPAFNELRHIFITDSKEMIEFAKNDFGDTTDSGSKARKITAEEVGFLIDTEILNELGPSMMLVDWDSPASQIINYESDCGFLDLASWHNFASCEDWRSIFAPSTLEFIDLNVQIDSFDWASMFVLELFGNDYANSWDIQFSKSSVSEFSVANERLEIFNEALRDISQKLRALNIGIDEIRLTLNSKISEWISGRPATFECLDAASQSWVELERLSTAQKVVLGSAVRLLMLQRDGKHDVIVIGDEFDGGLHQTATRSLYQFVDQVSRVAFLSTHSPTALTMHDFSRLHVSRTSVGHMKVNNWTPSGDLTQESSLLGVDSVYLLAAVRVVVLVEGEHDRIVISELLQANSSSTLGLGEVVVIPSRGHRGVSTIADSLVWMDYLDAQVVTVVDNANQSALEKMRTDALRLLNNGQKASQVVASVLGPLRTAKTSQEERTIIDLLERSIRTGNLNRISFFGFREMDIIEYFEPAQFKIEGTWADLRKDHKKNGMGRDFKKFLIEDKGATISGPILKKVVKNLNGIPEELSVLISKIQYLANSY